MSNQQSIEQDSDLLVNINSFQRHLKAENKSPATIRTYIDAATGFDEYLRLNGYTLDLADIKAEHVELFITDQLERHAPATAANRYRSLQSFIKWAVAEGEIDQSDDPFRNLKSPNVPEKHVRIVPEDELKRLLKSCAGTGFLERRDIAILRIFITSGARRSEVANLRISVDDPLVNDLDLDMGVARIMGKGARERMIPLDPKTVMALDRYLRARAKHNMSRLPWLWLGKKGRLTVDGIRQMVERRCEQAGIPKIHVHQLRHSFAHDWLNSEGNESDLMRLAGWRSSRRWSGAMPLLLQRNERSQRLA
jgi:site-specific recombinase XerD